MRRTRLAALLLLLTLAAAVQASTRPERTDDQVVGRLASGPLVHLMPDGSVAFSASSPILLDNGRTLELRDGRWVLFPEPGSEVKALSAIDLAVYRDDYVGQRIRLERVPLYGATIRDAIIRLPGTFAQLEYGAMPRDQIKRLLESCAGARPVPHCAVTVVATVAHRRVLDGWPLLVDPVVELAQQPARDLPPASQ